VKPRQPQQLDDDLKGSSLASDDDVIAGTTLTSVDACDGQFEEALTSRILRKDLPCPDRSAAHTLSHEDLRFLPRQPENTQDWQVLDLF